jgi:hypothetical protein
LDLVMHSGSLGNNADRAAGTKGMNYDIKGSKLGSPGKEFSMEKISLSLGQIVTGGCQFSVGHKDIPVRIARGGYIAKLRWIRQRYFTLWDVDDKRGWLVDGARTLLHLLRASLYQSSHDDVSSEFLFDESKFCEAAEPFTSRAALEVLINRTNRALDHYREEEKLEIVERTPPGGRIESTRQVRVRNTTIQDRIEELYETLEKLVDHKHSVEASYKGMDVKVRLMDHLEGWDFAELAGDRDPFHLKVTTLPSFAARMTWADYTRAIPAVTLFGKGFGELICPSTDAPCPRGQNDERQQACKDWASVPKDQNLLCASVADLQTITDQIGDISTNPITLAPGILWRAGSSTTTPLFSKCGCERPNTRQKPLPSHPIQELSPASMNFLHKTNENTPLELSSYPNGAVIFGTLERRWPWKRTPANAAVTTPGQPVELAGEQEARDEQTKLLETTKQSLSLAESVVSCPSSSSLGAGTGSTTPPTSVTSEGDSSGEKQTEKGANGKRRAWWSTGNSGEDQSREGEGGNDLLGRIKRPRGK